MQYDGTETTPTADVDQRISLMERFIGLDAARRDASRLRDESDKRHSEIREEMATLRMELRKIIDADADDVPMRGDR